MRSVRYRILIIEDEATWSSLMKKFLMYWSENLGISTTTIVVENAMDARHELLRGPHHAVALDLRVPEKRGGPLIPAPVGLELAASVGKSTPLTFGHIYTAWAEQHALELYKKASAGEVPTLPIWEKAARDNEGDDHYTQLQWAERILAAILPRESARELPLVRGRPNLFKKIEKCSPFGEAVDFAIGTGRFHLPSGLARCCSAIHQWTSCGNPKDELAAFREIFFLAETVQHWLWVQAAAWLAAMAPSPTARVRAVVFPGTGQGSGYGWAKVETALEDMLGSIATSEHRDLARIWLSHLHFGDLRVDLNVLDALRTVRKIRNDYAHVRGGEELPWQELALPMRLLMDACTFLAAYPVLLKPSPAPDGRWRFSVLKGEKTEGTPLSETECLLADGVLGEQERFSPPREDKNLYQLWPGPNGELSVLKLWPFAEQRVLMPEAKRNVWLIYGPDPRNSQRWWERNPSNGQENLSADLSSQRVAELRLYFANHH